VNYKCDQLDIINIYSEVEFNTARNSEKVQTAQQHCVATFYVHYATSVKLKIYYRPNQYTALSRNIINNI